MNEDLKKLLVASMGDDLHYRVECLVRYWGFLFVFAPCCLLCSWRIFVAWVWGRICLGLGQRHFQTNTRAMISSVLKFKKQCLHMCVKMERCLSMGDFAPNMLDAAFLLSVEPKMLCQSSDVIAWLFVFRGT